MEKFKPIKIKIRGGTVAIDKNILDMYAVVQYGELYETDEVKKKVRLDIRNMVGPGENVPHPLEVYRAITFSFLTAKQQKLLIKM